MNTFHTMTAEETARLLGTDIKNGLTDAEAAKRLRENGKNLLTEHKKKSVLKMLWEQISDFMTLILLAAAAVSFVTGIMSGETLADPIIILAIVILNAVVGVVQEARAQKSISALKRLSAPHATVIRDAKQIEIPAEEVVRGDVIVLSAGDIAAADCRIISAASAAADESALTGEAAAAEKNAELCRDAHIPIGDRKNMLFASTSLIRGQVRAIAVATGMGTEVGHIAAMLMDSGEEKTPLQRRLADTGKVLGITALIICAAIFIIGIVKKMPPAEMFMTAVSLAVAAIPEGLAAIVTITLAIGVTRMSKHNAIVRHLPSVETLGSASVICSDKTGTITENKMRVQYTFSKNEEMLLKYAAICTERDTKNPTELAILKRAEKLCRPNDFKIINSLPFGSEHKYMSVTVKSGGSFLTVTKGAAEVILRKCSRVVSDGGTAPLSSAEAGRIRNAEMTAAAKGLRVIAAAYREDMSAPRKMPEEGFVFLGLIGIEDPPRPEAAAATAECLRAGIRPVMITGDHAKTAESIAVRCGICKPGGRVMEGREIDRLDDNELQEKIRDCNVFARVAPIHKVRLVKAFKSMGEIVAMTGDGINDAPALKAADIGCSMGMSGTDVAKDASDMILTDDNFATIVVAVREGRTIFKNIKKAVQFLLSSNIGEILTVFTGIVFGISSPLTASQLLWVNLVTDSLPAIALGTDRCGDEIMSEPPERGGIFAHGLWRTIIWEGLMIGALATLAFTLGLRVWGDLTVGRTMAFTVLSVSQLVHAFNMKSEKSVLRTLFSNPRLNFSFAVGTVLQLAVVTLPVCSALFNVCPLSAVQWAVTAALSLMPLIIVELQKRINGDC